MTEAAVAPELQTKPAAPETVEVKIGETTVKVDKAAAGAIEAFRKAAEAAGVTSAAQLKEMQAKLDAATPKVAPNATDTADELETLLFTNPKEALKRIKDEISAGINAQVNQTNAQVAFWAEFYSQNPDLKDADWLVKAVMTREFGKLKGQNVPEAIKSLAETVKADILKLASKKGKADPAAVIEGANETVRSRSKPDNESKDSPTGITGVLKARREARRTGAKAAASA